MNFKKEIGRRIRAEREKVIDPGTGKAISLEEQSRRIKDQFGVILSKSRVSNYEQGLRLAKPGEIRVLAKFYGASAAYLGCLDVEEDEVTQDEMDLLRNYRKLPENERRSYLRRIAALAMIHSDPLPDERLPKAFTAPSPAKSQKTPVKAKRP